MKWLARICVLLICLAAVMPVRASEEPGPVEIYTIEDLFAMAEDPAGNYILMEDLDLSGVDWEGIDFSGTFDGNGHAILNVSITHPTGETATSYDGNLKTYDTGFAGFFSSIRNAEIKNLQLINLRALVDVDSPCFLGGLAGYSERSTITNCTVIGCLELRAFDRMFGVGGIIGYGNGTVTDCTADVTLICTDTDPNTRDEQFMGGIFSTGYMDVTNCTIIIDGYCSEYGYVHNGGITGMYMQYPLGEGYAGKLTGNTITGKITFFECNTNRRAYCEAEAGEVLASRRTISGNTKDFLRDERKEYDVELRPEMCATPTYTATVVDSGCSTYGYTEYVCDSCSYTYRDVYTLFSHTVTQWTIVDAPTTELEGMSEGHCDYCDMVFTRVEPVLEPVPTEPPTEPQPTEPAPSIPAEPLTGSRSLLPWFVLIICTVVLVYLLILLFKKKKQAVNG